MTTSEPPPGKTPRELVLDVSNWRRYRNRNSAHVRVRLKEADAADPTGWFGDDTIHTDSDGERDTFFANVISRLLLAFPDDSFPTAVELNQRLIALANQAEIDSSSDGSGGPLDNRYEVDDQGRTVVQLYVEDEPVGEPVVLANFSARITTDVTRDNSLQLEHHFEIEAVVRGNRHVVTVPAAKFESLDWVVAQLGASPIIAAAPNSRSKLREAIQTLSGTPRQQTIYTHLGWRVIRGEHLFLHSGGAIGADGVVGGIEVDVWETLAAYRLPEPPSDPAPLVQRLFKVIGELPDEATLPLLGTILGAPLDELVDGLQAVMLHGPTGSLKSSLIAALLHVAGGPFSARQPVVTFESTANALERLTFLAAQTPLWVDDLRPAATRSEQNSAQQAAQRVFRGSRTRAGRERLSSDATARPRYRPRCPVISSAEMLPRGSSTLARTLIVPMPTVELAAMSRLQDAAAEDFARIGAAWIQHIAGRYDQLAEKLPEVIAAERVQVVRRLPELHLGLDDALARLSAAWGVFLDFAFAIEALDEFDVAIWRDRALTAFELVATTANVQVDTTRPEQEYLEHVRELLEADRVHIDGLEHFSDGGDDAGWFSPANDEIHLRPAVVDPLIQQRYLLRFGLSFPFDEARRALKRRGLLVRTSPGHATASERRPGSKRSERVLVIKRGTLLEALDA